MTAFIEFDQPISKNGGFSETTEASPKIPDAQGNTMRSKSPLKTSSASIFRQVRLPHAMSWACVFLFSLIPLYWICIRQLVDSSSVTLMNEEAESALSLIDASDFHEHLIREMSNYGMEVRYSGRLAGDTLRKVVRSGRSSDHHWLVQTEESDPERSWFTIILCRASERAPGDILTRVRLSDTLWNVCLINTSFEDVRAVKIGKDELSLAIVFDNLAKCFSAQTQR